MGCYMSAPDKRVYVSDGAGKDFIYATASCQGWRRDQEDAEECIPYFDDDASLFILCDGHGGAEVAKYVVEHLPNFIKNHPLYKEGQYKEALENAFIEFDALLRTDDVMMELHKLAFDETPTKKKQLESKSLDDEPSGSAGTSSSNQINGRDEDDIDAETLRREAMIPLDSILEKYHPAIRALAEHSRKSRVIASPVIRAPKDDPNGEVSAASSSTDAATAVAGSSAPQLDEPGPSSTGTESKEPISFLGSTDDDDDENSDSGSDFLVKGESSSDEEDDDDDDDDDDEKDDGDDEGDNEAGEGPSSGPKKIRRKKHKPRNNDESDTSSEEEDDDLDSDDDSEEDEENEGQSADDEEEEEEDGDEDQWEDVNDGLKSRAHKPGMDSGCTVVVALVKDGQLYVASAGDSRCIMIMRNGECRPMSFDHKPEDAPEYERITKAGGRVTEGRVNGGLNLSRALGDFTYKNPDLPAREQMITACPDIQTAKLDPEEVEYLFLACDGIWNSMKNQQAAKFIRRREPNNKEQLIQACIELFRKCIAPRTDGDGTGCDNMTCILAKYGQNDLNTIKQENEKVEGNENDDKSKASHKRANSDDDESDDLPKKRRCLNL